MSAQKNKSPMIAVAALVLLLAAGAIAFFTQSSKNEDGQTTSQENVASVEDNQSDEADVTKLDTAAGNATEDTKKAEAVPDVNTDGMNVEPGNPIVAKVDGKDITRTDVYRFIQTMPDNIQQMPAVTVYPIAMEQVINTRLVQTEADKSKIEETPEFKFEMDIAKQQIARNLFLQKQVDSKITDAMVKKEYDDFIKKLPSVEERRARHILLDSEDKAKAVIEKLNKGGKFEELANELSVGPTATKGGDLGYFTKAEMVPEFANAAFSMKKDEIIQAPVKSQFGWHVIQVTDVRQRTKPTMEQMVPALRADISRKVLDDLIKDLRKDAKVEQFDINGKPLKDGANVIGIVPPKPEAETKKDG